MTDKIEIKITRGCGVDGSGGTIADYAVAILGAMPDQTPIVDVICAAFADTYGVHGETIEGELVPVSAYRNVSYRLRQHMTAIVAAYASKQAQIAAQQQAQTAVDLALGNVTIVDG